MTKPEKPETEKPGKSGSAPGQDKVYTVTNPATGETKEVTQREWREQKMAQAGWVKSPDMPDDE